jgi:predicted glycosyltransferase
LTGHAEQETEVAPRLERLGVGKRLSFDELTPQNIANIFREALQNFNTSNLVSRQFNGADVTAEILQNFLLDESTLEI